jgi:excisionase family DNA binding protein
MTDLAFSDHEYLTVKELADLLRLKERKIYDLAASRGVPCSEATGKPLFPAAEIRAWVDQSKSSRGAHAT